MSARLLRTCLLKQAPGRSDSKTPLTLMEALEISSAELWPAAPATLAAWLWSGVQDGLHSPARPRTPRSRRRATGPRKTTRE